MLEVVSTDGLVRTVAARAVQCHLARPRQLRSSQASQPELAQLSWRRRHSQSWLSSAGGGDIARKRRQQTTTYRHRLRHPGRADINRRHWKTAEHIRKMLLLLVLLGVGTLGGVSADSCEQRRQYLVSTGYPKPTAYAWPGQKVDLHCRPSRSGGCRWRKGTQVLGNDCRLVTSQRGVIKCMLGEEVYGSIEIKNPESQQVRRKGYYNRYNKYWQYSGSSSWGHKSSTYLCSRPGTIITKDRLCDGSTDCSGGEDEQVCTPPCGPPFVRENSALAETARDSYPDGDEVTYTCEHGFSFEETLSGLNRTCRRGRWERKPPFCRRNLALKRPVSVVGRTTAGADPQAAVDGHTDTWCMLTPSSQQQSLTVPLAANASVGKVLVRALNSRYSVTLRSDGDVVDCSCTDATTSDVHPPQSGVRVCTCPRQPAGDSVDVVVSSEGTNFMSLSVAEIVALEAPPSSEAEVDECTLLGQPAYGMYESGGGGTVKLACQPGYRPSCTEAVSCSSVRSGDVRATCLPLSCPQPPAIPNTVVRADNGTGWSAVAEYSCAAGYVLYPTEQNTTGVCDDALWSLSHLSCLPESDIRVVAMRMGQQHQRSMAELRSELETLLLQLLRQQNDTQHRLQKLEEEVELLGLADGARLQLEAAAELQQLDDGAADLQQLEEGAAELQQQEEGAAELQQQEEGAAELQQQGEGAADLQQLKEAAAELRELQESAELQQLE